MSELVPERERNHSHIKLTWSGLLRNEECTLKDSLYRAGHRSKFVNRRNFLQGTVVDLAMRAWLEEGGVGMSLLDRTKLVFEEQVEPTKEGLVKWRGDPAEDRRLILGRCVRSAERLAPWLEEHVLADGVNYQPEARGVGTIAVPAVDGTPHRVDLFFATDILTQVQVDANGLFSIYDLKITENETYTQGKTLAQLMFYAVGLAAHLQVPLATFQKLAFVTPLLKNIEQTVSPDREDYRYMLTRIQNYAQNRWAEKAVPKDVPDADCRWSCDVKRLCPHFAQDLPGKVSLLSAEARQDLGALDAF